MSFSFTTSRTFLSSISNPLFHPLFFPSCFSSWYFLLFIPFGAEGHHTAGSNFLGNFSSMAPNKGSGYALSRAKTLSIASFTSSSVGFPMAIVVSMWDWSCLNNLVAFLCSSASCEGCILFMTTNIPVEAENKSMEDSLRANSGAPPPPMEAARPTIAEAESVSMLTEFKRRVFQLSRWSPML
ncbi:hypothetical protein V8G54_034642 [Vigna mungo]|uniref:Uncharacterized protein n=1 Tax=Vigna mungo TaxID=3915 RepID=A0AAQ3MRL7_VIGMU